MYEVITKSKNTTYVHGSRMTAEAARALASTLDGATVREHITTDYRDMLPHVLTGAPVDYRFRSPHPPVVACSYCATHWCRAGLPVGRRQADRVVCWSGYMVGVLHGEDGNTYAWTGDILGLGNVVRIYLLAESMHV